MSVAVGYHCLGPYYGYVPDYEHRGHDQNDSRYL